MVNGDVLYFIMWSSLAIGLILGCYYKKRGYLFITSVFLSPFVSNLILSFLMTIYSMEFITLLFIPILIFIWGIIPVSIGNLFSYIWFNKKRTEEPDDFTHKSIFITHWPKLFLLIVVGLGYLWLLFYYNRFKFGELIDPIPNSVKMIDVEDEITYCYYEFSVSEKDLASIMDDLEIYKPDLHSAEYKTIGFSTGNYLKGKSRAFFKLPFKKFSSTTSKSPTYHIKYNHKMNVAYLLRISH